MHTPFAIFAPGVETHTILCDADLASAAAYLLTDGQGEARPSAPALSTADVNTILRVRRHDLAAALDTVEPVEGPLASTARRLAKQLRRVSHA
jgi:hypothetical protein